MMADISAMIEIHSELFKTLGFLYLARFSLTLGSYVLDGVKAYILPWIMPVNLKERFGQWGLVTGCTQGIGREYALALASKGLNVVLVSRRENVLKELADLIQTEYKVDTKVIVADFTKEEAVSTVVKEIDKSNIEIGVLVNNVGVMGDSFFKPFLETNTESINNMIRVNISTSTGLCHSLIPGMVVRGKGAVVNISSMTCFQPMPFVAVYAASKHYLQAFTLALATELSNTGVFVQEVDPGHVNTSLTTDVMPATPAPDPKTFVASAIRTLGHTGQTCGYWGHSLFHTISALFIPESWLQAFMSLMGWMHVKYINKKKQ